MDKLKTAVAVVTGIIGLTVALFGAAFGAELLPQCADAKPLGSTDPQACTVEMRSFNWQDREYFGSSYVYRTLGGGDAAAGESGDAGASASSGDSGGNGDGCGPR